MTATATGAKYWLSVFSRNRYRPRDDGHDLRNDAEPGDLFEFTTSKTKGGYPNLKISLKITAAPAT